jgi:hypothetical protein
VALTDARAGLIPRSRPHARARRPPFWRIGSRARVKFTRSGTVGRYGRQNKPPRPGRLKPDGQSHTIGTATPYCQSNIAPSDVAGPILAIKRCPTLHTRTVLTAPRPLADTERRLTSSLHRPSDGQERQAKGACLTPTDGGTKDDAK